MITGVDDVYNMYSIKHYEHILAIQNMINWQPKNLSLATNIVELNLKNPE